MQVPIGPEGTATVVLDSSGDGTAKVGPAGTREAWQPLVASVICSSNNSEARCRVYLGDSEATWRFIDGTLSGSTGDSTGNVAGLPVPFGRWIWAVWTGGDPGATATLTVNGTKTV